MKKRIRLGQPFLVLSMLCFFVGLIVIVIVFGREDEGYIGTLIVCISFCIISLLILSFSDNFGYYMEMKYATVYVKTLFFTKAEYSKKATILQYGVYELRGRYRTAWVPCLIIGTTIPDVILLSKETTGDRKLFKGEYFLVLLTNKRLEEITKYFNQPINLPKEREWKEFCQSGGMYAKELWTFYRKIQEYNNLQIL